MLVSWVRSIHETIIFLNKNQWSTNVSLVSNQKLIYIGCISWILSSNFVGQPIQKAYNKCNDFLSPNHRSHDQTNVSLLVSPGNSAIRLFGWRIRKKKKSKKSTEYFTTEQRPSFCCKCDATVMESGLEMCPCSTNSADYNYFSSLKRSFSSLQFQ